MRSACSLGRRHASYRLPLSVLAQVGVAAAVAAGVWTVNRAISMARLPVSYMCVQFKTLCSPLRVPTRSTAMQA